MAEVVTVVGGVEYLLGDLAHVSGLQWSTGWPYGCLDAGWQMDLRPNTFPRALAKDARVEIWDGPIRVWTGFLSEANPGEQWELKARGWWAAFANLLALDATPAPTAVPSVAVAEAITRAGLPVTVGSTLQSTSITSAEETVTLNYVSPLLDAYAEQIGQRWGVDADYVLRVAADPTTPTLVYESADPLRGTADDNYVTDVYPRFVSSVDGTTGEANGWGLGHVSTASQPAGRRERAMDLTDLSILPAGVTTANEYAQSQLDLNGARMGYTSGLTVHYGELTALGGAPKRLGHIRAGEMFRSFNVADASGQVQLGMTADVVIGQTTYTDGESTVQIKPVDMAARSFVDRWQKLEQAASGKTFDGTAA